MKIKILAVVMIATDELSNLFIVDDKSLHYKFVDFNYQGLQPCRVYNIY